MENPETAEQQETKLEERDRKYGLRLVGAMGGATRAVTRYDDFLLAGVGYRVGVFRLEADGKPTWVGESAPLGNIVERIVAHGNRAYVETEGRVHLLDLADPRRPVVIGDIYLQEHILGWNSSTSGLAAHGTFLYLAGESKLFVFDASELASPREVAALDLEVPPWRVMKKRRRGEAVYPTDLFALANRLYVATGRALVILSLDNPARPAFVGAVGLPESATCIVATDTIAILGTERGFWTVDLSDPSEPRPLATVGTARGVWGLAVSGNRAYLASSDGLYVVDVAKPDEPRILSLTGALWFADGVAVSADFAYVADDRGGLSVLDCSSPTRPEHVPVEVTVPNVAAVALRDGYAYVLDERGILLQHTREKFLPGKIGGLRAVDLTAPSTVHPIGDYMLAGQVTWIAQTNRGLYVEKHDGVEFVDLSDPAQPRWVGRVTGPLNSGGFVPVGNRAYAARDDGLLIASIVKPTVTRQLGLVPIPGGLVGVAVAEKRVYAIGGDSLYVIDIGRPKAARILGIARIKAKDGFAPGQSVAVQEPYAYVGAGDALHVFDVSDPEHPAQIAATDFAMADTPRTIVLAGERAYMTMWWYIVVANIANPTRPELVAWTAISDSENEVGMLAVHGEDIYVAGGDCGLLVFRV